MLPQNTLQILPLSPIDCVFVGPGSYPIEFVFFYEHQLTKVLHGTLIEKAWLTLGDRYPILKSRLVVYDGRYGLAWDHQSRLKPISWQTTEGAIHPNNHSSPYSLVDPVKTAANESLASLKISEGRDGTVLGFSLSHAVGDGFTYFLILSDLASLIRELMTTGTISPLPVTVMNYDRSILQTLVNEDNPVTDSSEIASRSNAELSGFTISHMRTDIERTTIQHARREFPKTALTSLYEEFSGSPKRLSTNDMICSVLWRDYVRNFDDGPSRELSLVAPVDFRRIHRRLQRHYVGNAVVLARTDVDRCKILDASLDTALLIRQSISEINETYIVTTLKHLASKIGEDPCAGLGNIHIVDPHAGLLITNLSRMSLSTLDLGMGPPAYCRPLTPCKRAIVLLSDGADGVIAHIQY
jgi:hypothetical protein